jgi:ribose transport system permease protein
MSDVARGARRDWWLAFFERYTLVLLFVATLVFFSVWGETADTFLTADNIKNVLGNQSVIGILSLAIMIPLVSGRFDFAVGPVAGLSQVLTAGFMARLGVPLGIAVLVGLSVGVVVGVVTGTTVAKIGVNSLIVTLGVAAMLSGVVLWYTDSQSIINGISQDLVDFGSGTWLGVPRTMYVLAVVALLVHYLLERTPYGRYLHSIGSNESAARLVGIPVERFVLLSFVLSGTLAAFAGVLLVARNGSASPQVGTVSESLQALSAVFLGATAIRPGRFNVVGTLVAIFFLAFTITGLSLAGVESWITDVTNGAALFIAVIVSTLIGRRRAPAL